MTTRGALDPDDDIERVLGDLIARSSGRAPAAIDLDAPLADMALDGLSLAHLRYHVQESFHVDIEGAQTVREMANRVRERAYWRYAPPPGTGALDRARGDFWPRFLRPMLHLVMRGLARLAFGYRAEGARGIPSQGPFLLVANHTGHADAPALMAAVPMRRVNDTHPLAAQDYFFSRPLVEGATRLFVNALPVDRHARIGDAMGDAVELLREGHGLILFPEGTRSPDGALAPFKKGVGFLLAGKPWPVIPAHISGSHEVLPKGAKMLHFARLGVRLGAPRDYAERADTPEEWARIAKELEEEVRALAAS